MNNTTITKRNNLLDRVIRVCGFEHELTIDFAHAIEREDLTDEQLEFIAETYEEAGHILDELYSR